MNKILGFMALFFLLSENTYASTKPGKGDLKLDSFTVERFIKYIRGKGQNQPAYFYVTPDGNYSLYLYCATGNCAMKANPAIQCEEKVGKECKVFARRRTIKWINGINPGKGRASNIKSKWSDAEIIAKLTELGFIGSGTTTTSSTTSIDKGNIVSQIKDLKELLDTGIITQDEFEKAKKKLLN